MPHTCYQAFHAAQLTTTCDHAMRRSAGSNFTRVGYPQSADLRANSHLQAVCIPSKSQEAHAFSRGVLDAFNMLNANALPDPLGHGQSVVLFQLPLHNSCAVSVLWLHPIHCPSLRLLRQPPCTRPFQRFVLSLILHVFANNADRTPSFRV